MAMLNNQMVNIIASLLVGELWGPRCHHLSYAFYWRNCYGRLLTIHLNCTDLLNFWETHAFPPRLQIFWSHFLGSYGSLLAPRRTTVTVRQEHERLGLCRSQRHGSRAQVRVRATVATVPVFSDGWVDGSWSPLKQECSWSAFQAELAIFSKRWSQFNLFINLYWETYVTYID